MRRLRAGWTAVTGTGAAASLGLALLVLVTVFVAVAAPRASFQQRTRALQHTVGGENTVASSMDATVGYSDVQIALDRPVRPADLAAAQAELRQHFRQAHLPLAPDRDAWAGLAVNPAQAPAAPRSAYAETHPPQLELIWRSNLPAHAHLVSGHLPGAGGGSGPVPVAVTGTTAARFGLHTGSRLALSNGVTITVTGIIQPTGTRSSYWAIDPTAAAPQLVHTTYGSPAVWSGAALISSTEVTSLERALGTPGTIELEWNFPLNLSGLTASQAGPLAQHITSATENGGTLVTSTNDLPTNVSIVSGLVTDLSAFNAEDASISSLTALLFVSLAAIGIVVVLLGAGLMVQRRQDELALMRARGAGPRQLATVTLRGGAVVTVPAAGCGVALAVLLTPGPSAPLAWPLAAMTVAFALAGPPVIAVIRHGGRPRWARARRMGRRAQARRLVAEAALICAAVGGLILLKDQGLPAPGHLSVLLSLAPVLAAVPAAILVVRGYPVVLRWLLRLSRGGRGVTGYVGLARGTRASLSAVLPIFALVLALAVIAFGAMVRDAVNRGQVTASWLATGADAVVGEADSGISLTPVAQRAIAAVPGVRRSATTLDTTGAVGTYNAGGTQLNICVLDPVSYAAVLAGTPAPQFPAAKLARGQERDGRVPVLASPAAASLIKHAGKIVTVGTRSVPVQIVGTIRSTPAVPQGGTFIIYPRWATAHSNVIPPDVMFLNAPHLDQRALAAVVRRTAPDAELTLRSQLLAGYRAAPLPHAGYLAFAEGAVAAAGFCVLILLLMLVLGARARELTLARLTTMGLSRSQARRLAAVETLPAILAATVGGLACAWAMAPLVGPELDLSVFTNGALSVPVYADAPALIITAAALVLLTLATLTVQAFVASRRASQLLRIEG